MSEEDGDFLKLYEVMSDRITDLNKSYRVLNDSHRTLEVGVSNIDKKIEVGLTKVNTKIDTTVSIVKWFISPIALISLLIQIYLFLR